MITVIPSAVALLVTEMSALWVTVERVRLTWDDMVPLITVVPAVVCRPVLHLFEVRRAWLVAVPGGVFMGVPWRLTDGGPDIGALGLLALLGGIVVYPSAVMVTASRTPVVWRVLPLVLFAGLFWLGT